MAGGTITRIALGGSSTLVEENFTGFYDTLAMSAGENNAFKASTTNHGKPDQPPAGKFFIKGWWTDAKDKPIKEAVIGDTIRFHIQTQNIKDDEKVNFTVYEWDNLKWMNDKLELTDKDTGKESTTITIKGGKGYVEWTTGEASRALLNESLEGNELEMFVECTYKDEQLDLPVNTWDYLILYEKEVLITVIVELPHSHYTFGKAAKAAWEKQWDEAQTMAVNSLGLAGHSAMSIGERYFDYGPDNRPGTYSEKDYDVDFNKDGDKDDDVYLASPSYMDSPGRPWWGENVAKKLGIKPTDVKLNQVLDYIKLKWQLTGIYGEVHTIEFYVKESEAHKMIIWWEERYKHLKVYSVFPWTGEQCTTAVKTAIQQAFPFKITQLLGGKNWIPDTTQAPAGLLEDLKSFVSTSKKHASALAKNKIIKEESKDFKG